MIYNSKYRTLPNKSKNECSLIGSKKRLRLLNTTIIESAQRLGGPHNEHVTKRGQERNVE